VTPNRLRKPVTTQARRTVPSDARTGAAGAKRPSGAGPNGGRVKSVRPRAATEPRRVRLLPVAAPARVGDASVRWSRVKAARARIVAGFYDRDDVRERLLEAVLDELSDG